MKILQPENETVLLKELPPGKTFTLGFKRYLKLNSSPIVYGMYWVVWLDTCELIKLYGGEFVIPVKLTVEFD